MPRVIRFELVASDSRRAMEFYRDIFNWEFDEREHHGEYWPIRTGDDAEQGINGVLIRRTESRESAAILIGVTNLDESIGKVEANGGRIVLPKLRVPGVGYLAYGMDTEGNTFGMVQADAPAT